MLVWVSLVIATVAVIIAGYTFYILRNMNIRSNAAATIDSMGGQVLKRQIDAVDKRLTNFVDLFLKKENGECVGDVCPLSPSPPPPESPPKSGGFDGMIAPMLQMVMSSFMSSQESSASSSVAPPEQPPMAEEVHDTLEDSGGEHDEVGSEEGGGSTEELPAEEQGGI